MSKYTISSRFIGSKFAQNSLFYITSSLVVGFLGYLFNFIVSRQLSVAQYGELQSLFAVLSIFGVFSSALGYFIVKHVSVFAAHEDLESNRGFTVYLFRKTKWFIFIFFIAYIILIPALNHLLHLSDSWGLAAIGVVILISLLSVIYGEILRGWNKFFILAGISIFTAAVKLISGVGLAMIFHRASAVSFSIFLTALFGWFLIRLYSRRILASLEQSSASDDWKEKYFSKRNIRKTVVQVFIFSMGIILVSNLDILIVKSLMPPDVAGYYGALSILGKIILIINLAVVAVMLPEACAQGYQGKRPDAKHILGSYGLIIIFSLILILIYLFWPQFIVSSLFGNKYLLQANNLWLFGSMSFSISLLTLEANLAFAKHEFRVIYFLVIVVIGMILGAKSYHANLREIVSVFNIVLFLGYFAVLSLNLSGEKKGRDLAAEIKT